MVSYRGARVLWEGRVSDLLERLWKGSQERVLKSEEEFACGEAGRGHSK